MYIRIYKSTWIKQKVKKHTHTHKTNRKCCRGNLNASTNGQTYDLHFASCLGMPKNGENTKNINFFHKYTSIPKKWMFFTAPIFSKKVAPPELEHRWGRDHHHNPGLDVMKYEEFFVMKFVHRISLNLSIKNFFVFSLSFPSLSKPIQMDQHRSTICPWFHTILLIIWPVTPVI